MLLSLKQAAGLRAPAIQESGLLCHTLQSKLNATDMTHLQVSVQAPPNRGGQDEAQPGGPVQLKELAEQMSANLGSETSGWPHTSWTGWVAAFPALPALL